MRCKYMVLGLAGNPTAIRCVLIAAAGALAVIAMLTLGGCGGSSSQGTGTPVAGASPSPPAAARPTAASQPTATAGGRTPATALDDVSAADLQQIVASAAARVSDAKWKTYLAGSEDTASLHSKTRGGNELYSFFIKGKSSYSPPLKAGDRVDYLSVGHVRYWRVNEGPWKNDPDEPPDPSSEPDFFPSWYPLISVPVGVPVSTTISGPADSWKSPPGGSVTYTLTATGMSVSGPTTSPAGRCWDLNIRYEMSETAPPPPNATAWPIAQQYVLTVCEPDFLVTKFLTVLYDGRQLIEDSYEYNTGVPLSKPDQVTEVRCPPYSAVSSDRINCWFGG